MKKVTVIFIILALIQVVGCAEKVETDIKESPSLSQEEAPEVPEEAETEVDKEDGEEKIEVADEENQEVDILTASKSLIFDGFPIERIDLVKPEKIHTVEIHTHKIQPDNDFLNSYLLIYLTDAKEEEINQYLEELIDIDESSPINYAGTIDGLLAIGSYTEMYDEFLEREFKYVSLRLGLEPGEAHGDNPYFEFPTDDFIDLPADAISHSQIFQNSINVYEEDVYSTRHFESFTTNLSPEEILKFYQDFTSGKDELQYFEDETEHVFIWSQGKYDCELRIRKEKSPLDTDIKAVITEEKNFLD